MPDPPSPAEFAATRWTLVQQAGGNKAKAARVLGISRMTLYRKLKDLGID